jgi:hypothetical protein
MGAALFLPPSKSKNTPTGLEESCLFASFGGLNRNFRKELHEGLSD